MNLSLAELPLPVYLRPETPMTEDDLLRFCAVNEAVRIEREPNGELLIMSPTGGYTGNLNFTLCLLLGEWTIADGRGLGFDSNTGFTLPDGSMRAADAAWVELRRWHALTNNERQRFAPLCPDFVLELRSPSDTLKDLQRKMLQWIDNGAQVAWLLDPIDRAVTVYRPGQAPERHEDPNSIQGTGPIAGFELVLARLWGKERA